MQPSISNRMISQETFDEIVRGNIDDLGMENSEAIEDAVETLILQGVDLSGIVRCLPGGAEDNSLVQCLNRLKQLNSDWENVDMGELEVFLKKLEEFCRVDENIAIVSRWGGVELLCSLCSKCRVGYQNIINSALRALASCIHDVKSRDAFHRSGGGEVVISILNDHNNMNITLSHAFEVVTAAASGDEIMKETFMDLKIYEIIIRILRDNKGSDFKSLYQSIRVILTADDDRVVASQVFNYARKFEKLGVTRLLVEALEKGLGSPDLVPACAALKAVSVNDEICRSVAENGGLCAIFRCIDGEPTKIEARVCLSLLSKLAGSDENKAEIVKNGGMTKLVELARRLGDDPCALQEVMSIICALCLRSPGNAADAIEAGAGELSIRAMRKFPSAIQLQKNSCLMIRNLVARNPENRIVLLDKGVEEVVRAAKVNHEDCKNAAAAALRDLGFNDYLL